MQLREASIDDLMAIVDIATAHDPDDPTDPVMLRFRWESMPEGERAVRMLAQMSGSNVGYFAAGHEPWAEEEPHFGWIRSVLLPEHWTEGRFLQLVDAAEDWQRAEGTTTTVARPRERFGAQIALYERLGYRRVRRQKNWELDLVARRVQLLKAADRSRARMKDLGIEMLTLDRAPDVFEKIYELTTESEQDIPTSMPIRVLPFDDWRRLWFDEPGIREDRVWIARDGDAIVGISMIGFPPIRGVPSTAYTGTARSVRGRGVARALKYETVAQAIELGATRIRTSNDARTRPFCISTRRWVTSQSIP